MKHWNRGRLVLPLALLALAVAGCGGGGNQSSNPFGNSSGSGSGSSDPQGTRLRAKAEAVVNGNAVELNGEFLNENGRERLKGELEDSGLAAGTSISFCLVHASKSTPLAVGVTGKNDEGEIEEQDEAEFELDSQEGQTVPTVVAGDKLEARQGATSSGTADCAATLLISATFQPENEEMQEVELHAENKMESGGVEVELRGDFRSEFDRQRLRGEFKDSALVSGTPVSFCLVTSSGSTALAVAKTGSNHDNEAQFELDSKKGQTVPTVVVGNKLEARQGAMTSGTADCSAPLLASANFQPKEQEDNGGDH